MTLWSQLFVNERNAATGFRSQDIKAIELQERQIAKFNLSPSGRA